MITHKFWKQWLSKDKAERQEHAEEISKILITHIHAIESSELSKDDKLKAITTFVNGYFEDLEMTIRSEEC